MIAFLADHRGAVSVLAAGAMLLMVGMTAITVDVGLWYLKRRDLQNAVDAAALAAAQDPASAQGIAANLMAKNGFATANLKTVSAGYYCGSTTLPATGRFTAGPNPVCASVTAPNAVRLEGAAEMPAFFVRPLLKIANQPLQLSAHATAARIDAAGLRAGTGIAGVSAADSLVMNATINSLLGGGNVGLTAGHYNALASADVDGRALLDRLALELDLEGGTYRQLLDSQVSVDQLLDAAISALGTPGLAIDAATAIAGLQALQGKVPAANAISLGDLFGLGIWQDSRIGGPAAINAGLNALQLATAGLQLANGQNVLASAETVTLPGGLANATVEVSAIEPPQQPYFAFGPAGTQVHTAQIRTKFTLRLVGQLVQLPFYLDLGSGDARIDKIDCGANPATDAQVRVAGRSAAANLYLGTVSAGPAALRNFSTPVSVSPAWLLNVPVPLIGSVAVGFSAHVPLGMGNETTVVFTRQGNPAIGQPPQPGGKAQLVSSINGSLGTGLLNSLTLTTNPLNLGGVVSALGAVTSLVNNTIKPVFALVDPALDALLKALGVKLGFMDLWVPGVRCGMPVLVT
jgi:uncharacterized membrane protein